MFGIESGFPADHKKKNKFWQTEKLKLGKLKKFKYISLI